MRLFLASYRFGDHQDRFLELAGTPGKVAVIANAADAWPPAARESAAVSDCAPLRKLGFQPSEVDLRDYVDRTDALAATLAEFPVVWVRGGNTFVLRAQCARSGTDRVLRDRLADDSLVYAGYSAGACLLTPSLHGIEAADDPDEVLPTCGIEPIWDGLGLVDRAIVPHWNSVIDTDNASRTIVDRYLADDTPHWALTDHQAIVVNGESVQRL
ncbi:Type 1 glutamine amidotransferase-like domain-containing protein [Antrihabitans cavernicola]|uniref:Peptidase n=1 Tax=Antrihabitans cavernicola TaxID=2495913 RepID=A0A5A7S946_9NOCA|nr:Type 1 glutamine amidotransferase-like domain-containing protein [Spelaeibacter cavernicola]KAA0022436.1 peptidase [Spelaeibacter cavernicola]